MIKYISTILILVFLVGGCVSSPPSTGTAYPKDNKPVKPEGKPELKACDQAIDYKVLIAAMPKELSGYVSGEPRGATLTFQDPSSQKTNKYSTASVYFTQENSEWATETIDISIVDTCYIHFLSQTFLAFFELESTEGFVKKATINGYPGWHQYQKYDNSYSYSVLIKDRVIVSVKGKEGVPDSDVEKVMKSIDLASIAAAAK